ncbi:MAG TPA: hypothetical protein VGC47_03815 [Acidimicrobiia bacterium]|jgi:hypothetical protein
MVRPPTIAALTIAPPILFATAADTGGPQAETPMALLVIAGLLLIALTTAGFVALVRERNDRRHHGDTNVEDEPETGAAAFVVDLRPVVTAPGMDRERRHDQMRLSDPWIGSDRPSNGAGNRLRDPWQPSGGPTAAPSELCAIDGIGAAMAKRLNALGVARLADLASLDEHATAELKSRLGRFGHMLDRYDWVGQARRLHSSSGV